MRSTTSRLPEDPAYATVGGFVLDQLGFIPRGGESFEYGEFRFTVVEMDGKRVARVKIERIRALNDDAEECGGRGRLRRASGRAYDSGFGGCDPVRSHSDSSARTR